MVTAADFRTLVLVAADAELQQIAIERRAKVEEFQRKHRTGLLTLLFTDIVDSTKLKQTFGDREAVILIQRHHAVIREILGHFDGGQNHMRMVNFYCLEAFKPIPRDHDLCTRAIQKGTYMPRYVVVILDNDNVRLLDIRPNPTMTRSPHVRMRPTHRPFHMLKI